MDQRIEALPDIGALRQVQGALWGIGVTKGAAVMVGAGLSRCASRAAGDAPRAPLWTDLATEMAAAIYPKGDRPIDPLRLAEEYEAALGRNALDELVRRQVNDSSLSPSPLHRSLVALPWADILTTNWDTLLERAAADDPDRYYAPVLTPSDIASTRSPRIVKLHGSLPSHLPLVFTEEDFRTYPVRAAPFVNLAQQVLMENSLCLVGFSGDDPNFLQWSGWVRDHLGIHSPTIYLVGALDLSTAKRRMLERRGVTPIDFSPIVGDVDGDRKHTIALELFISSLREARPWPKHRWPEDREPKASPAENGDVPPIPEEKTPDSCFSAWAELRRSYPGWVVAPFLSRIRLEPLVYEGLKLQAVLAGHQAPARDAALFDYAWLHQIALKSLPSGIADKLAEIARAATSELSEKARTQIGLWLLREAREAGNLSDFDEWFSWLSPRCDGDFAAELRWQQCLWARDRLQFGTLESLLSEVRGEDPMWDLRRAALLADLSREREAFEAAMNALRALRVRSAQDRRSIWVSSRVAWAIFICRVTGRWGDFKIPTEVLGDDEEEDWPSHLSRIRRDPWEERRYVDDELRKALQAEKRQGLEVKNLFDPGHVNWTEHIGNGPAEKPEHIRARRFIEDAGIPRVLGWVNLTGNTPGDALRLGGIQSARDICSLVLIGNREDLLDEMLHRVAVVRLRQDIVDEAIPLLRASLDDSLRRAERSSLHDDNWQETSTWSGRAGRAAEILSRLLVRASTNQTEECLQRGFEIARSCRGADWGFYKPLSHLLSRGLSALPPARRTSFALSALEVPIPGEGDLKGTHEHDWPEPFYEFAKPKLGHLIETPRWSRRVSDLSMLAKTEIGLGRHRSLLRLMRLHDWGMLTANEAKLFGEAIWSRREKEGGLPEDTGLLPHVFLSLPCPERAVALAAFEANVVKITESGQPHPDHIVALHQAAHYNPPEARYRLKRSDAKNWLSSLLAMTRSRGRVGPANDQFDRAEHLRRDRNLGWVLSRAVLPALKPSDLSDEAFEIAIGAAASTSIAIALPAMASLRPEFVERVEIAIGDLFASGDEPSWHDAASALLEWITIAENGHLSAPPGELIAEVSYGMRSRGKAILRDALEVARLIVPKGLFSPSDLRRLEQGLTILSRERKYPAEGVARFDHVSLLRVACVKLSHELRAAGHCSTAVNYWLEIALDDPLPEVRFALSTGDDVPEPESLDDKDAAAATSTVSR